MSDRTPEQWAAIEGEFANVAKMTYLIYRATIAAGFTADQAIHLVTHWITILYGDVFKVAKQQTTSAADLATMAALFGNTPKA